MDYLNRQTFKQKVGGQIEQIACDYLQKQGLLLIEKNYRSWQGEIDLIMHDKNLLVFIEVRYRKSDIYGSALESIDKRKQHRIIATAENYLIRFRMSETWPCRFDVVGVSGHLQSPIIEWIKQAFE